MADYKKDLYTKIRSSVNSFNVPYEQFVVDIQDPKKLKRLHSNLRANSFALPDYDVFSSKISGQDEWVSDFVNQSKIDKDRYVRLTSGDSVLTEEDKKELNRNRINYYDWNSDETIEMHNKIKGKINSLTDDLSKLDVFSHDYQEKALAADLFGQADKVMSADREDKGFFSGVKDAATNRDFYTAGISELELAGYLLSLSSKFDKGGELKPNETLTDADKTLLEAVYVNDEAQSRSKRGLGYSVGSGAAQSIPFMVQFAATSGAGSLGGKAAVKLISSAAKKIFGRTIRNKAIKKGLSLGAGAIAQSSLMPSTYSGILKRRAGEVRANDLGGLSFDAETKETWGASVYGGFVDNVAETFTERLGGEIIGKAVKTGLGRGATSLLGESRVSKILDLKPVQIAKQLSLGLEESKIAKAVGFDGYLPEVAEEYMVAPLKDLLNVEYNETKNLVEGGLRPHLEIFLTTAVISGTMGGGHFLGSQPNKINYKKKLNKQFLSQSSKLLEFISKEEIDTFDKYIEESSVEKLSKGFEKMLGGTSRFSAEQKELLLNYANLKLQKEGIAASMQHYVDRLYESQAEQVNAMSNDRGQLVRAKTKRGEDVFLVGDSNIKTKDDGSINYEESDGHIVIQREMGGEKEFLHIQDLEDVEVYDSGEFKKNLKDEIEAQTQAQDEIENAEPKLEQGEKVRVSAPNGEEEIGEITGFDAEGNVQVRIGGVADGKTVIVPVNSVGRFEEDKLSEGLSNEREQVITGQSADAPKEFEVMLGREPNKMIETGEGEYRLDTEYQDRKTAEKQKRVLEQQYEDYEWRIESEKEQGEFARSKHKVVAVKKGGATEQAQLSPMEQYEALQEKGYADELVREEMQNEANLLRTQAEQLRKGSEKLSIEERVEAKKQASELEAHAQEYERLANKGGEVLNTYKAKREKALKTDDATLPLRSLVAKYFLLGNRINSKELQGELGLDRGSSEFRGALRLMGKNAPTIDALQESLLQNYSAEQAEAISMDTNAFRNTVLEVLSEAGRGNMNETLSDMVLDGAETNTARAEQHYIEQRQAEYEATKRGLMNSGYSEERAEEILRGEQSNVEQEVPVEFAEEEHVPFSKKRFEYFTGSISDMFAQIKNSGNKFIKKIVAPVSSRLLRDLSNSGLELSGNFNHVIDNSAIQHVLNRHGEGKEQTENQEPVTEHDFGRIDEVVNGYDKISLTQDKGNTTIKYQKTFPDGTTIYIEEVRKGRKELALKTMYKKRANRSGVLMSKNSSNSTANPLPDSSLLNSNDKGTQLSEKDQNVSDKLQKLSASNPKSLPIVVVGKQSDLDTHNELSEGVRQSVQAESKQGNKINAFVANGKVFFVLENIGSEQRALELWIHEQGIHVGLDAVFGENKVKILSLVANYLKEGKGNQSLYAKLQKTYKGSSDVQIAEEYLAHLAEKQVQGEAFTEAEQTIWDKFKEILQQFIDVMYHTNYTLSDKQVGMLVQATVAEMNKQGETVESSENNTKFAKSNKGDDLSKRISQGKHGTQAEKIRGTEEEVTSGLRRRYAENERNARENSQELSKSELEARSAEEYAKEKGLWIPYSGVMDLGYPYKGGNENDNYLDVKEGFVYKVNNLMNNRGLVSQTLSNTSNHNNIFPDTKLEFVGFTGFDGGSIFPVFRQRYIDDATEASPSEIADYMQKLGFEQVNATTFTNKTYTVSDLRPRNVLKDAEGDIYVIDSEVQGVNAQLSIEVDKAEKEVSTNPSEKQIEAGNYKKGHVRVQGLNITIENPKGSVRSGVDNDGKEWSVTMNNTYGYFKGTEGKDGDHIDTFLGNNLESDRVFVIDQVDEKGAFDEHKVMFGFTSEQEAKEAYLSNYSEGWNGLGSITEMSVDNLKKWAKKSGKRVKPVSELKQFATGGTRFSKSLKSSDYATALEFANAQREWLEQGQSDKAVLDNTAGGNVLRFSKIDSDENLVALHNLTENNLLHADKMGGFAVPSIAVARVDKGFTSFGDISLIADKSMVDPADSRNKTFNSDVYSPRYPTVHYAIDAKAFENVFGKANELGQKYGFYDVDVYADDVESEGVGGLKRKKTVMLAYLIDTNQSLPRVKYTEIKVSGSKKTLDRMANAAALDKKVLGTSSKRVKYEEWLNKKAKEFITGERIFKGYTPSGNRRYIPHTIENVFKELKGRAQAKEGFNFGIGMLRSVLAYKYRNVEQIQNDRNKIISHEVFEEVRVRLNNDFFEIIDELKPYAKIPTDSWEYNDNMIAGLMEYAERGRSFAFNNLPSEMKGKINNFFNDLRNAEAEYFESKVQRIVPLSEFTSAIVPKGTSPKALDILDKNGITYKKYDRTKENDRDKKLELASRQAGVRFSKDNPYIRRYMAMEDLQEEVKEAGLRLKVNKGNANVILYHGTSKENADKIRESGKIDKGTFFSHAKTITGFGDSSPEYYAKVKNKDGIVLEIQANPESISFVGGTGEFYADDDLLFEDGNLVRFSKQKSSEVEQEMADIAAKAEKEGTFMKAPNGKPTNLNERQWLQVRTQNFKKWFGDWEKTARIGTLKGTDDIVIADKDYKGKYELNRDSAKQYMKDNLRGTYTNKDTGDVISLERKGVNKVFSHDENSKAHLQSVVAIPQIIEQSIFIAERLNEKGNGKYDSYRYYLSGLKIGGENYVAKVVVGVKDNVKFYDHRLTEIEKGALIDSVNRLAKSDGSNNNTLSDYKDTRLFDILKINSSKVVDENNEPLVCYHGTGAEFNTFNDRKFGQSDSGWLGRGFYFTTDVDYAESYGNIKEVFLSIKKPEDVKGNIFPLTMQNSLGVANSSEVQNKLKESNKDGIIAADIDEYVVFSPSQIKSATANTGEFSSENDDVRFSLVKQEYDLTTEREKYDGERYSVKDGDVFTTYYVSSENTPEYTETIGRGIDVDEVERDALGADNADSDHTVIDIRAVDLKIPISDIKDDYGLEEDDYDNIEDIAEDYLEGFIEDADIEDYNIDEEQYVVYESRRDNHLTDDMITDVRNRLSSEVGVNIEKYTSFYLDRNGNMTGEAYDLENEELENLPVTMRIADHTHNPANGHNDLNVLIADNNHTAGHSFARGARTDLNFGSDSDIDEIVSEIKDYWRDYAERNYEEVRFSKTAPVMPNKPKAENYSNALDFADALRNYENTEMPKWRKENDTFQAEKRNLKTKLVERLFDRWHTVKQMIGEVGNAIGKKLADSENPYVMELLRDSKGQRKMEVFQDTIYRPLLEIVRKLERKGKVAYADVKMYLLAKHAIERNAYMKEKDSVENGSGIETGEAEQIVKEFESKVGDALLQELWDSVKKATQFTLDTQYKGGLISRKLYNHIKGMYDFYVPMRGWEEQTSEDIFDYMNRPFPKSSLQKMKQAKGRSSLADDPIPYIASMAETAIVTAGKNEVRQALLNMARNHKQPQLYSVKQMWFVNTGTEQNPHWVEQSEKPSDELIDKGMAFPRKADTKTLGHKITPMQQQAHHVAVWENGEKVLVEFVRPDMAGAINGENQMDSGALGKALGMFGSLTRMMSRNFTSRNPSFTMVNLTRDMGYATLMNSVKHGSGKAFLSNIPRCTDALRTMIFSPSKFNPSNNEMHKHLKEFLDEGGETGFLHLRDIKAHGKEMRRMLKNLRDPNLWNSTEKAGMAVLEFVEKGNRLAEDISRFTTYYTLRKKGHTVQQSAFEAKEITVNFNRKGTVSAVIGNLYAFFNAAMQGVYNFGTAADKHKGKVAVASFGLMALGVIIPALCRMIGGKDDDDIYWYDNIPEYERCNHLIIPLGGKDFVKIPLPQILRAFYGWGESVDGYIAGKHDAGETMRTMVGNFFDDLSPVSITGGGVRAIIPMVVSPFYDNLVNENFAGFNIYKEPYMLKDEGMSPQHTMAGYGANPLLVELSRLSNALGGGSDYRPAGIRFRNGKYEQSWIGDKLDWNPSKVEHVVETFGGGMLTFLNNTYKLGLSATGLGEKIESKNIPVVRRFYREAKPKSIASKYYELKEGSDIYKKFFEEDKKHGNTIEWTEKILNTKEMQILNIFNVSEKQLRKISKIENAAAGDKEALNNIEEMKEEIQRQAVELIEEIQKAG